MASYGPFQHPSSMSCQSAQRVPGSHPARDSQNTHRSGAMLHAQCWQNRDSTLHSLPPRSMQSYPESRVIESSRSEATNHCPPFLLTLVAVRSDWDHHKSEANGFWRIPGRLSASPNWLELIERRPIIRPSKGFALVARVPPRHTTLFDVVRKFFAQHFHVPGHVDSSVLLSGPSTMEILTVLWCNQSPHHVLHRPTWNLELRSARLSFWLIGGSRRAWHAMGLRHFKTVRRQRIVPFP
jgi:hypothetical protein